MGTAKYKIVISLEVEVDKCGDDSNYYCGESYAQYIANKYAELANNKSISGETIKVEEVSLIKS